MGFLASLFGFEQHFPGDAYTAGALDGVGGEKGSGAHDVPSFYIKEGGRAHRLLGAIGWTLRSDKSVKDGSGQLDSPFGVVLEYGLKKDEKQKEAKNPPAPASYPIEALGYRQAA